MIFILFHRCLSRRILALQQIQLVTVYRPVSHSNITNQPSLKMTTVLSSFHCQNSWGTLKDFNSYIANPPLKSYQISNTSLQTFALVESQGNAHGNYKLQEVPLFGQVRFNNMFIRETQISPIKKKTPVLEGRHLDHIKSSLLTKGRH